jgi:hypothetical protein
VQTKQKWALRLMFALGAVSCGGSTQPGDPYQGTIDATVLDAKFQTPATCGSNKRDKCFFEAKKSYSGGTQFSYFYLGFVAKSDKNLGKDALGRPLLPAPAVKINAYDFPEGCVAGKEYDERTDSYRQDAQYAVFDALPIVNATTMPLPLPLVKVHSWTGTAKTACNAIKDLKSLTAGDFGGAAAEDESFAFRAIVDPALVPYPYPPEVKFGWYRGLQLAYFDSQLDASTAVDADNNVRTMDGVWLKATSSETGPALTSNFLFQAKPGEQKWSPVVRLREYVVPSGASYKSLCYDPPCATDALDMTKVTTYTGMVFLASQPQ